MIIKKVFLYIFVLHSTVKVIDASTLITIDFPKSFVTWYKQMQIAAADAVKELNLLYQQHRINIILGFKPSSYEPHITLNYMTPENFRLKDFLAKHPRLSDSLKFIASNHNTINITKNLREANIELWRASNQKIALPNGKMITNILWVVIELKHSAELTALSEIIKSKLIELRVPLDTRLSFKAHATLGQIYDINNFQVDQLKADIQNIFIAKKLRELLSNYPHSLKINSIILKSGSGVQEYKLKSIPEVTKITVKPPELQHKIDILETEELIRGTNQKPVKKNQPEYYWTQQQKELGREGSYIEMGQIRAKVKTLGLTQVSSDLALLRLRLSGLRARL